MTKGLYIFSALLLGLGSYFLYKKIKDGNVNLNPKNESVTQTEEGSHLNPPMEAPDKIPSLSTTPIV